MARHLGLIVRGPQLVLGHSFLAELYPVVVSPRVVGPVEHGVVGKDMQTTPNKEQDAKRIYSMRNNYHERQTVAIHGKEYTLSVLILLVISVIS